MSKVYHEADSEISAAVGESLIIELEANPTTGYEWQIELDSDKVELIARSHQPAGSGIGAGGNERITLRPLRGGATSIRAAYKRSWEHTAIKERQFQLHIKQ